MYSKSMSVTGWVSFFQQLGLQAYAGSLHGCREPSTLLPMQFPASVLLFLFSVVSLWKLIVTLRTFYPFLSKAPV